MLCYHLLCVPGLGSAIVAGCHFAWAPSRHSFVSTGLLILEFQMPERVHRPVARQGSCGRLVWVWQRCDSNGCKGLAMISVYGGCTRWRAGGRIRRVRVGDLRIMQVNG